jgi:hypothetical protein
MWYSLRCVIIICIVIYNLKRKGCNAFLIWAGIFGVGAVLAHCLTQYMAIIAFVVWLVVFFKDVHFDIEKAFGKYKIK